MTNNELKNKLQIIANSPIDSIEKAVAQEALDYDEIQNFFSDILNHGCVTGMVGSLIYYADTHDFFDKHYDQIEELRNEYEENTGIPLPIKYDLKNHLAWFSFEETAYKMANEFEIEI